MLHAIDIQSEQMSGDNRTAQRTGHTGRMKLEILGHILVTRILQTPLDLQAPGHRGNDLASVRTAVFGQRKRHRHGR